MVEGEGGGLGLGYVRMSMKGWVRIMVKGKRARLVNG